MSATHQTTGHYCENCTMPVIWKRENITSFVSDVWMTVSTPKRYTNPFQHKIQNYWGVVKSTLIFATIFVDSSDIETSRKGFQTEVKGPEIWDIGQAAVPGC